MTIVQAIALADRVAANDIEQAIKLKWLSDLDLQLVDEVFNRHRGTCIQNFNGYDETTDANSTELLVKAPYDMLYVDYLEMRIHQQHKEIERYNNARLIYERSRARFDNYINSHYMPHGVCALRF